jgi:hypothetical protein
MQVLLVLEAHWWVVVIYYSHKFSLSFFHSILGN